jgi:alcohol dehydrogenase YqhD (iron-dependent ADH family)
MLNFNFKNPNNILFGKGKIATIKECVPSESWALMNKKEKGANHDSK